MKKIRKYDQTTKEFIQERLNKSDIDFPLIYADDVCSKLIYDYSFTADSQSLFNFAHKYSCGNLNASNCYFYQFKLSGEISTEPTNNSLGLDLSLPANNLQLQIIKRNLSTNIESIVEEVNLSYLSDNRILFNYSTLFINNADYELFYLIKRGEVGEFTSIGDTGKFVVNCQIVRSPKAAYFETFIIPYGILNNVNEKFIEFSNIAFDGFYSVNVYVEVQEFDINGVLNNLDNAQILYIFDEIINDYRQIMSSVIYAENTPTPQAKVINYTLQSSVIVKITGSNFTNRKLKIKVLLPNGLNKRIYGGFAQIQYKGNSDFANKKLII